MCIRDSPPTPTPEEELIRAETIQESKDQVEQLKDDARKAGDYDSLEVMESAENDHADYSKNREIASVTKLPTSRIVDAKKRNKRRANKPRKKTIQQR